MKPLDDQALQTLIEAGKSDEALALLRDSLTSELTDAEKGAIYLKMLSLSLNATNQINRRYLGALKQTETDLRLINKAEKRVDDKAATDTVRRKIANT